MTGVQIDQEFRALIPALSLEEREQLEANLRRDGCRDPLVTWQGLLLDGHNRFDICKANGWQFGIAQQTCVDRDDAKIWIIQNQFGRRNLQPFQRGELALKLEPLFAAKAKAKQATSTGGKSPQLLQISAKADAIDTRQSLAKVAGLSHDTIAKVKVIADKAPEDVKQQLRRGEVTINNAYQDIKGKERRKERVKRIQETEASNTDLDTERPVPILYCDPPWQYEHVKTDNRAIENQYPTMTLEKICALPVSAIATDDAVLFMWATSPKLAEAMRVLEAWGFTYRTCLVWVKDKIGMGYYARQQHELLLVASRGALPVPEPKNRPSSVVMAKRGKHSKKPDVFYELIERMYPEFDGLRKELFLRGAPRKGWTGWGNQAGGDANA